MKPQFRQRWRRWRVGAWPAVRPHAEQGTGRSSASTSFLDLERLLGHLVVGELTDVDPVVLDVIFRDATGAREHQPDQIVDPKVFPVRDEIHDRWLHAVDPGEDLGPEVRLLVDAGEI